jgi:hypothetical protein
VDDEGAIDADEEKELSAETRPGGGRGGVCFPIILEYHIIKSISLTSSDATVASADLYRRELGNLYLLCISSITSSGF